MPTHVYANNNEIASKASEGKSIAAFPDVCFSPPAPPVGPMPLPYPNTGECTNTDKGTSNVFIKDKMVGMEGDSCFSKSMGDEAATQNFTKGMITSALQGKCYFGLWSMDVQMEGKGVPRHLDMVTHNHASQPGNDPCGSDLSISSPPAETDKTASEITEILDATFKFYPQYEGTQKDNDMFGYCGSPVTLSAIGKLLNSEKIEFKVKNNNDGSCIVAMSDDVSTNMWKTTWNPDPGIKDDTEFNLDAKSSNVSSGISCKNYIVKKIDIQRTYQIVDVGRFFLTLKDGIITVSVNMKFDYYEGLYDSWADEYNSFDEYIYGQVGINYNVVNNKVNIGNGQYRELDYKESEKVRFRKEAWKNRSNYKLVSDQSTRSKMANEAKSLVSRVQNFFNNRFSVSRKYCIHKDGCTCIYPIQFKFHVLESGNGNYIHKIKIFERKIIADSGTFGLTSVLNSTPIFNTWAHEIGHLMGYYDEYPSAYGYAVKDKLTHVWKKSSGCLMDSGCPLMLRKEYAYSILLWLRNVTKMDFKSEI